jgi:hypothetical protein
MPDLRRPGGYIIAGNPVAFGPFFQIAARGLYVPEIMQDKIDIELLLLMGKGNAAAKTVGATKGSAQP